MYRVLCAVFFCMSAVSTAPQDTSDFTFVKPLTEPFESANEALETIPLTTRNETTENIQNPNEDTTPSIESEENNSTFTKTEFSTLETSSEATDQNNVSEEIAPQTEVYQSRVKPIKFPSPRFTSKLGYFKNSDRYSSTGQTNFIERSGKRKFKSRCRCEKITNCPKLQITVPRCPDEYFLCCF